MTEDMLHNCLLCCPDQPDNTEHYLQCPHVFAFNLCSNPSTGPDPIVRLGLINPDLNDLKYICCNFSAYHALKAKIRAGAIQTPSAACNNIDIGNHHCGAARRRCWSVFSEAFQAEAGELAINCRRFSLPQSIYFLANHSPASSSVN